MIVPAPARMSAKRGRLGPDIEYQLVGATASTTLCRRCIGRKFVRDNHISRHRNFRAVIFVGRERARRIEHVRLVQ